MDPRCRQRHIARLCGVLSDVATGREVEAACHAISQDAAEYEDHLCRALVNLRHHPAAGWEVVFLADDALAEGTPVGALLAEQEAQAVRFEQMLQEKYEALNDVAVKKIVRCRRCRSGEVTWEEKQTRSADEAATLYCLCTKCGQRWVER